MKTAGQNDGEEDSHRAEQHRLHAGNSTQHRPPVKQPARQQPHCRQTTQRPAHIVLPPFDLRHGNGRVHGYGNDQRLQHHTRSP